MARALAPGTTVNLEVTVTNSGGLDDTQDVLLSARNGGSQTVDQVTGLTLTSGETSNVLNLTWSIPQDQALDTYDLVVVTEDDELVVDTYILREANTVPPKGVSRWTFDTDNTNSGTAIDVWGSNGGTINGGVTTDINGANQTYLTDEAYNFNGTDGYVNTNYSPTTNTAFAWSLWFRTTDTGTWIAGTDVTASDASDGVFLALNSGNLQVGSGSGASFNSLGTGSTAVNDGEWHSAILVYDGTNGILYLDGSEELNSSWSPYDSTENLYIARRGARDSSYLNGDVDDVRVYDAEPTRNEVSRLYKEGSILSYEPFPANALNRYEFEQDVTDSWIGIDGTDNTSAGYTTDSVLGTYAKQFDGADDYVGLEPYDTFNQYTVSLWVKGSTGAALGLTQNNNIEIRSNNSTWAIRMNDSFINGPGNNFGEYTHVLGSWDGSTLRYYVNGSIQGSLSISSSNSKGEGTAIGRRSNVGGFEAYLDGIVDDVRVYSEGISGREVFNLYENGSIRETTGTIVDDFEPQLYSNIGNSLGDYYTGDLSNYSITSSNTIQGINALDFDGSNSQLIIGSYEGEGLPVYPGPGDTVLFSVRVPSGGVPEVLFGADSGFNTFYEATVIPSSNEIRIRKDSSDLSSLTVPMTTGESYTFELSYGANGNHSLTIQEDDNGDRQTVTATDSDYLNASIGVRSGSTGAFTVDNIRLL